MAVTLNYLGLLNNRRALFLAIPLSVMASCNAVFTDTFFTYGNVPAALGLFTLLLITAVSKAPPDPLRL
ncbi:MAG: hypothetical protein LBC79_08940, partial [Deltaproteobacteria bacterium]|nr:hypothetical protein [Deltaproteobacteria bacterium]